MVKKIPILYNEKEECCGCSACFAICARDAIVMIPDIQGFIYPTVDADRCVGCHMCLQVCPIKKK